ncbi:MAG: BrnA antitoxin family protein [candidate division KSB1 bacterium]|nr:BrnA antitoxin family protein [candidate division KSB1 bacterium]
MPNSGKRVDPIPDEFATYEDAAVFWDTHDTTDYPDAFQTVEVEEVALRQRRYEVEIDEDVVRMLQEQARKRALPISRLASDLLRQQLLPSSTSSPS